MKRLFVTTSIGGLGLCALLLVPLQGCTDLNETPISSITPSNFFHTPGEVLAALAGVYAGLRNTASEGEYWGVSEVSTDEMVVPTRGSDWYDNGTWLETHRQTWSANSPATLSFVNNVWNTAYAGIARANVLVEALQSTTVPNQAAIEGEARDRKSTRLNSSHDQISYAVFCLKKKKQQSPAHPAQCHSRRES